MSPEKFSEAMNELAPGYVEEAVQYRKRKKGGKSVWAKRGVMAACLCVLAAGGLMLKQNRFHAVPSPDPVQVSNPILTVGSVDEMEEYLDFKVPVLDKEIESCSVLVEGGYPGMGQINYKDGSEFRIKYGSGDISGIYGGTLVETEVIEGTEIGYYRYEDTAYAIWECGGFTFSYAYTGDCSADVESIIQQIR